MILSLRNSRRHLVKHIFSGNHHVFLSDMSIFLVAQSRCNLSKVLFFINNMTSLASFLGGDLPKNKSRGWCKKASTQTLESLDLTVFPSPTSEHFWAMKISESKTEFQVLLKQDKNNTRTNVFVIECIPSQHFLNPYVFWDSPKIGELSLSNC